MQKLLSLNRSVIAHALAIDKLKAEMELLNREEVDGDDEEVVTPEVPDENENVHVDDSDSDSENENTESEVITADMIANMVDGILSSTFETHFNRFYDTNINWIQRVTSEQPPVEWKGFVGELVATTTSSLFGGDGGRSSSRTVDAFDLRDIRMNGHETCDTLAPGDCYVFKGRMHMLELHLRMPVFVRQFEYVHVNKQMIVDDDSEGDERYRLWKASPKIFAIEGKRVASVVDVDGHGDRSNNESDSEWRNVIEVAVGDDALDSNQSSSSPQLIQMQMPFNACSIAIPLNAERKVNLLRVRFSNWGADTISVYRMRVRGEYYHSQEEEEEEEIVGEEEG